MIATLQVYREGSRWFFDDIKKNIEHEELTNGFPDILCKLLNDQTVATCTVELSNIEIPNSSVLDRLDQYDPLGGMYYTLPTSDGTIKGWMSLVFWDYFKPPVNPKKLWISVIAL